MNQLLYPPVSRLEAELFGPPAPAPAAGPDDIDPAWNDAPPPELPEFLREHIERKVAAQAAYPPAAPAVGQIRAISAIRDGQGGTIRPLGRSVALLLGAHVAGRRWRGWLVTADTDYAGDRDLIIEEDDGPADPLAGMVMTGLPIETALNGNEAILARLSASRLAAVDLLAEAPGGAEPLPPRPGHIFARDIAPGHVAVTGSPLGGPADPRHAYRALHHRLAEEITAAAQAKAAAEGAGSEEKSGFLAWLFGRQWAPAPVLAGVLALFAAQAMLAPAPEPTEHTMQFRGSAPSLPDCAKLPRLRVIFKSDAGQQAVVLLLRKNEAQVVSGPSETGEWWLSLPAGAAQDEALAQFRRSPLVADAILIERKESACQP